MFKELSQCNTFLFIYKKEFLVIEYSPQWRNVFALDYFHLSSDQQTAEPKANGLPMETDSGEKHAKLN